MAHQRYDVLVIGGGAMGSSAAWWLARSGHSVCVLEQFGPGHEHGSSHGSSRVFRLVYPDPHYVQLAQQALPWWRELETQTNTTLLTTTGGIDHGNRLDLDALSRTLQQSGADHQILTAPEATDRWPQFRFTTHVLYQPDAGRINADATVAALHTAATSHRADIRHHQPVLQLQVGTDTVTAQTAEGTYQAPVAVIAAGAWTPTLLAGIIDLPPLRIVQAETFHFPTCTAAAWPTFNHDHDDLSMYGLATTSEGIKVAEHRTNGPHTTATDRTHTIDPHTRAHLHHYVQQWLPGLHPTATAEKTCLYTMTDNEDFIIDRRGPLVVNSSCSGHAFKFTPLIGKLLADLAVNHAHTHQRFTLTPGAKHL